MGDLVGVTFNTSQQPPGRPARSHPAKARGCPTRRAYRHSRSYPKDPQSRRYARSDERGVGADPEQPGARDCALGDSSSDRKWSSWVRPRPWDVGALQRRRPETYVPKDTMRLPGIGPHDDRLAVISQHARQLVRGNEAQPQRSQPHWYAHNRRATKCLPERVTSPTCMTNTESS